MKNVEVVNHIRVKEREAQIKKQKQLVKYYCLEIP